MAPARQPSRAISILWTFRSSKRSVGRARGPDAAPLGGSSPVRDTIAVLFQGPPVTSSISRQPRYFRAVSQNRRAGRVFLQPSIGCSWHVLGLLPVMAVVSRGKFPTTSLLTGMRFYPLRRFVPRKSRCQVLLQKTALCTRTNLNLRSYEN